MRTFIIGLIMTLAVTFPVMAQDDTNPPMQSHKGINLASIEKMCVHKDRNSKWESILGTLSGLIHIPDVTALVKEGEHILCAYADRKTGNTDAGNSGATSTTNGS